MRIAVLSNLGSGKNKAGVDEIETPLVAAGAAVHHFDGRRTLKSHCEEILAEGVDLLILNSGDGMVQGFWSALLDVAPEEWPLMALLPRGTTNMTHHDIGLRNARTQDIERLLAYARNDALEPFIITRSAVRVDHLKEGTQCGAFFGAAAVVDAIRICKARFHRQGFRGDMAHGLTVLRMLFDLMRGRGKIAERGGARIGIRVDGEPVAGDRILLAIASTLDRLLFNSRPFWGHGDGPLKATWVDFPAKRLASVCFRVMAGMDLRERPAPGYWSVRAGRIELDYDDPIVLDGEFYEPLPEQPLVLSTTPEARFVRF